MRRAARCVLLAVVAAGGCKDRPPRPVLRIAYEVDLEKAVDALRARPTDVVDAKRAAEARADALARTVVTIRERLRVHGVRGAAVAADGERIVVDLPALRSDERDVIGDVISRTGELELAVVDGDAAPMKAIADHVGTNPAADDPQARAEGITAHVEQWPLADGTIVTDRYLSAADREEVMPVAAGKARGCWNPDKVVTDGRIRCEVSGREVLARYLRALAESPALLAVAADHQLGYGPIVDGTERPFWRTYDLARWPRMIGPKVRRAAGHRAAAGRREIAVAFDEQGRAALAELTTPMVGKRLAIVIDGVVRSAPIVKLPVTRGGLSIDLGVDVSYGQDEDVRALVDVLRVGALAAPVRAASVSELGAAGSPPGSP